MQARRRPELSARRRTLLVPFLTLVAMVLAGCSQPLPPTAAPAKTPVAAAGPAKTPVAAAAEDTSQAGSTLSVSSPELVSDHPLDSRPQDGLYGTVVVGWGGTVTAVWERADADRGYRAARLVAATRAADGAWSEPIPVSPPFNSNVSSFDVAAGAGPDVSVVWSTRTGGRRLVFESHLDSGRWTSPRLVGRGRDPKIAMDGRGRASVVWFHHGNLIRSRTRAGRWSPVHRYLGRSFSYGLDIASNRAGDQVALWNGPGFADTARAVHRSRRSPRWPTDAEGIRGRSFDDSGPGITVTPDGSALAAWAIAGGTGWTHRGPDTAWSPLAKVTRDAGLISDYGNVEVASNHRGEALALWQAENGSFAGRYRPAAGPGPARRLSSGSSFFRAAGTPMLTSTGTAVVAGTTWVDDTTGYRVAYRWQEPGHAWSRVVRVEGTHGVRDGTATAGATGDRLAVFFSNSSGSSAPSERGMYAVIIDPRS